jgi:hypothetical protein
LRARTSAAFFRDELAQLMKLGKKPDSTAPRSAAVTRCDGLRPVHAVELPRLRGGWRRR